jgi:imidazolonepropionase
MLLTGIGQLVTNDPQLGPGPLGQISDAAVLTEGDRVVWAGPAARTPQAAGAERIDVEGRCVIPGFVDSHTHLVFAGDRTAEFESRLAGQRYDGGGIVDTVRQTRAAATSDLAAATRRRAVDALRAGTTTMEVKSGYGLTTEHERGLLEVVRAVGGPDLPELVATFLGAHVVAPEHRGRPEDYVALVTGEMLDACAPLARWCDVFCEPTVFDGDQARTVLEAGRRHGLGLRLHANQLEHGPGAQLAAELGATSADHLTHLRDADIVALADAGVIATLLPVAELSTGSPPAPARRLLDGGVTVALATDCNPGTSYTTSMALVIALACLQLRMTPDEALWAATAGGAAALQRPDLGRLAPGARADAVVLDASRHSHLAYRPGMSLTAMVLKAGHLVWDGGRHG